jgi:alpha-beta hydrolase superfamily lysophospholipase
VIADTLPVSWSLAQVLLSSSYTGWGTSSLKKDAAELAKCVSYFRGLKKGKIVIMGHSTGCQDVMEYLIGPDSKNRPLVNGAIIQASISDREAMVEFMPNGLYERSIIVAKGMVAAGKGKEIIPSSETKGFFGAPCTATRWLSLASPEHDGDDDYFSTDLEIDQLKKTFGSLPAKSPLCILYSGNDQFVPKWVDKKALVEKWISIANSGTGKVDEKASGIVEGATHNLNGDSEEVVERLVTRVNTFLESL